MTRLGLSRAILPGKLIPPRPVPTLVQRGALLRKLEHSRQIVVVTAPAGFGKTTLVAGWINSSTAPFVWYSLDPNDDDVVTLLEGILAAIRKTNREHARLASIVDSGSVPSMVAGIVTALAEGSQSMTLVLDDVHHIVDQTTTNAVQYLIDHLPPNVRMIVIGRSRPGFRFGPWRLQQRLTEFNGDDLLFSSEDARSLLALAIGQSMSPDLTETIVNRIGGWAAGLQLVAIAIRDRPVAETMATPGRIAESLAFDYLAEEVLQGFTEPVRRFLCSVSILNELTAPACFALTGDQLSGQHLARFARDGLFLSPIGIDRFRFHDLFRDFLRGALDREYPDQIADLYLRASRFAEHSSNLAAAVDFAIGGGHTVRAAALLERHGDRMWTPAEMVSLVRWTAAFSDEQWQRHPRLLLFRAWALLLTNQLQLAAKTLDDAYPIVQSTLGSKELIGIWYAIRASLTARYDASSAVGIYALAGRALPKTILNWRSAVWLGLGQTQLRLDDPAAAIQPLVDAVEVGKQSGNLFGASYAAYYLGHAHLRRSMLREASGAFEEAGRIAGDEAEPASLWGMLGSAEVALEEWRPETAAGLALRAVRLAKERADHEAVGSASLILGRLELVQGDLDRAAELLSQARMAAGAAPVSLLIERVHYWLGRLVIAQGDPVAIGALVDQLSHRATEPMTLRSRLLLARAHAAISCQADATAALFGASAYSSATFDRVVDLSLVQALACSNDQARSVTLLTPALMFGRQQGIRFPFLVEGDALRPILRAAVQQGVETEFVSSLLHDLPGKHVLRTGQALIEPLSEIELSLLRLLARGLTNQQIAAARVIGVNTVKWHLKNIYGKLGVVNRTAAVTSARTLGLI